jgi:predicted transcriptional regulator
MAGSLPVQERRLEKRARPGFSHNSSPHEKTTPGTPPRESIDQMEIKDIAVHIHEELQSIISSIDKISGSFDRIASAIEALDPKAPSTEIKARRAPARKKVLVKDGVVQKIKRIPSTKIIYDILQKSANGMDTTALMKATGFDQRKIHNVTFRLKNQGKITTVGRGVYKAV